MLEGSPPGAATALGGARNEPCLPWWVGYPSPGSPPHPHPPRLPPPGACVWVCPRLSISQKLGVWELGLQNDSPDRRGPARACRCRGRRPADSSAASPLTGHGDSQQGYLRAGIGMTMRYWSLEWRWGCLETGAGQSWDLGRGHLAAWRRLARFLSVGASPPPGHWTPFRMFLAPPGLSLGPARAPPVWTTEQLWVCSASLCTSPPLPGSTPLAGACTFLWWILRACKPPPLCC
mmetsp:Transcript_22416/g.42749  ORF Transcript_22416/g.42749 Transcript_22416/m.42749 type:complete len:234 (+) Transcript_22416:1212-1913(+)